MYVYQASNILQLPSRLKISSDCHVLSFERPAFP
jgi:hypothetical protein